MKKQNDKRSAAQCHSMDEIRAEIDAIDNALVDLLADRSTYIDRAWRLKQQGNGQALVQWRVNDVLEKVRARATQKGLSPELAEALWRQMIDWFIRYESENLDEHRKGQE